jgi:CubicO group peptidase (beta-lactamase class C family)
MFSPLISRPRLQSKYKDTSCTKPYEYGCSLNLKRGYGGRLYPRYGSDKFALACRRRNNGVKIMNEMPSWLDPGLAYARSWLAYQMRKTEQPGCSFAISYKGKIVLTEALGSANLNTGEKLTPEHRFRVASHSKTFTAAALMMLREQGKVKLDDGIGQFVSGLHPNIAASTIAQLLSNTTGMFCDGLEGNYWSGCEPFLNKARLLRDLTLPPTIEAGRRFKYSNHGFALAGLVIEAIVKEPYIDWMQREINSAAGLSDTTADVTPEAISKLASGHSDKTLLGRRLVLHGDQSTNALAPATGYISTTADLCRFFGLLSPCADASPLSSVSRREMIRPQWRDPYSLDQRDYGLGTISGTLNGWDWFGHNGGFPGYLTRTAVVPDQALAVSVLTNASDGKAQDWVNGILGILQRFHNQPLPPQRNLDWSGRWWHVFGTIDLVAIGERVVLASPDLVDPLLKAPECEVVGPDEARIVEAGAFHRYGETVKLIRGESGCVAAVQIAEGKWLSERDLRRELIERYDGAPRSGPPAGEN